MSWVLHPHEWIDAVLREWVGSLGNSDPGPLPASCFLVSILFLLLHYVVIQL
jgi:hypothetical protein